MRISDWSSDVCSSDLDAVLGATATASFGLYFLHGPLVRPVVRIVAPFVPDGQPVLGLIAGIGATFAGWLLLSWAVIFLARLILGRRSRLVIGACRPCLRDRKSVG